MSTPVLLHGGEEHTEGDGIHVESGAQTVKIISFFAVPAICFLGAGPILFLSKVLEHPRVLSVLNCLAAGFLFGFGFLHILPDAVEEFDEAGYAEDVDSYPIVYLIALTTFVLIVVLERSLAHYVAHAQEPDADKESLVAPAALAQSSADNDVELASCCAPREEAAQASSSSCNCAQGCGCHGDDDKPQLDAEGNPMPRQPCGCRSSEVCLANAIVRIAQQPPPQPKDVDAHSHAHAFHTHEIPVNTKSPYAAYLLTAGMSFHSIFEGLAIGLGTKSYSTLTIFLAVLIHKLSEAFAMGVSLHRARVSKVKFIGLVLIFASVIPIGVGIGMGVLASLDEQAKALASAILNGMAVGVFMFIAILGVMVEEFTTGHDIPLKGGVMILAATAMGFISLLE